MQQRLRSFANGASLTTRREWRLRKLHNTRQRIRRDQPANGFDLGVRAGTFLVDPRDKGETVASHDQNLGNVSQVLRGQIAILRQAGLQQIG